MRTHSSVAVVANASDQHLNRLREILRGDCACLEIIEYQSILSAMNKLRDRSNLSVIFFRLAEPTIRQLNDLRTIRALYGHIRLVIIADSDRQRHVLAAVQAGMHGYIPTHLEPAEFNRAVLAVWNGRIYAPASIANAEIIKEESIDIVSEQPYALLSRKQQEIFVLLRGGLSNKEIAQRINVSETAIKSQNRVIYRKLGALKRTDFVHC